MPLFVASTHNDRQSTLGFDSVSAFGRARIATHLEFIEASAEPVRATHQAICELSRWRQFA